jgi:1,4-dihydroxy-2-naphthoate octaprenyltransferase
MIGLLYLLSQSGINLSNRLVDLNLDKVNERDTFAIFLGGLVLAFVVNFFILASRKNEYTYDELRAVINAVKN